MLIPRSGMRFPLVFACLVPCVWELSFRVMLSGLPGPSYLECSPLPHSPAPAILPWAVPAVVFSFGYLMVFLPWAH